jgi:hypothetical protein
MLVIPLLLGLTRTLGSHVGEEGHRRSVCLQIETLYEFYLSTSPFFWSCCWELASLHRLIFHWFCWLLTSNSFVLEKHSFLFLFSLDCLDGIHLKSLGGAGKITKGLCYPSMWWHQGTRGVGLGSPSNKVRNQASNNWDGNNKSILKSGDRQPI